MPKAHTDTQRARKIILSCFHCAGNFLFGGEQLFSKNKQIIIIMSGEIIHWERAPRLMAILTVIILMFKHNYEVLWELLVELTRQWQFVFKGPLEL